MFYDDSRHSDSVFFGMGMMDTFPIVLGLAAVIVAVLVEINRRRT